jgi:hypothetical protein
MSRILKLGLLIAVTLYPLISFAQKPTSDVEMGTKVPKPTSDVEMSSSAQPIIEAESQVQTGLPAFLVKIQQAQAMLRKNNWEGAQANIQQAKDALDITMVKLEKITTYEEVDLGLKHIELNLREALFALQHHRKADANREIGDAYKTTKALSVSPLLKLTTAKVSIGAANREILNKNYSNAGSLLQRAIDDLNALQGNSTVDQQEINSLKNDIVIAHQQVILGKKISDKNYLNQLYDRASAASSNALYQYYDMWTRTTLPWDQY